MIDDKIQLLLVEDDEDDYLILKGYLNELSSLAIDCHWECSPRAALDAAANQAFDICFIDYILEGINGIELIHKLKQTDFKTPIIMLTGKGTREVDLLAMELGISDFLKKNELNPAVIERCIRYAIERSNTLTKLKESNRRLKSISKKLIGTQEQERKIVAQELHGSIGSSLAAIKFALESKLNQITHDKPWSKAIRIESIVNMTSEVLDEVRRISHNLRPPILDKLGILVTISWMCRNFRKINQHIETKTDIQVEEADIPEYLKIVIYRILQESMTNVAKHSKADTIWIGLWKTGMYLNLDIKDNGKGVENLDSAAKILGFGIEGIKHRCDLTNGTCEVKSAAGKGVTYKIVWPI